MDIPQSSADVPDSLSSSAEELSADIHRLELMIDENWREYFEAKEALGAMDDGFEAAAQERKDDGHSDCSNSSKREVWVAEAKRSSEDYQELESRATSSKTRANIFKAAKSRLERDHAFILKQL